MVEAKGLDKEDLIGKSDPLVELWTQKSHVEETVSTKSSACRLKADCHQDAMHIHPIYSLASLLLYWALTRAPGGCRSTSSARWTRRGTSASTCSSRSPRRRRCGCKSTTGTASTSRCLPLPDMHVWK